MPTYNFRNKKTGEEFQQIMSISEMLEFIKDKNIEQLIGAPLIVSGINLKPDNGFREVLSKAKNAHYKSTIDTF